MCKSLAKSLRTIIGGEYSSHIQIQDKKIPKISHKSEIITFIRCYIVSVVDFDIGKKYSKCRKVERSIELLSLSGSMRFHRDASLVLPLHKAIELLNFELLWTRACLLLPFLRELTFIEAGPKSFSVGIMRRCFHGFVLHVSDEVICASWNDKCFASVSIFKLNCT